MAPSLLLVGLWGCASAPVSDADVSVRALDPGIRSYLLDATAAAEDIPESGRIGARQIYRSLSSGDLVTARRQLTAMGAVDSELNRVLAAQLAFAEGRTDEARRVLGTEPAGAAGQLLSARLLDLAGESTAAVRGYWGLRGEVKAAAERVDDLLPGVVEQTQAVFDRSLADGDLPAASRALGDLETWASNAVGTRRAAVQLARTGGDRGVELSAWRSLAQVTPPARDEMFAWAELELTDGNPDQALEIARALVETSADDPRARELLARSEFTWRTRLLPARARSVLAEPVLNRGQLALALYWLFPQARYAEPSEVRIASDVLESPYRQEIVQIVNAGLMDVDPAGHRFRPELPANRDAAVAGVISMLRAGGASCAAAAAGGCDVLARCEVVTTAQCQAGESISGGEFSDWARRAQEVLAGP